MLTCQWKQIKSTKLPTYTVITCDVCGKRVGIPPEQLAKEHDNDVAKFIEAYKDTLCAGSQAKAANIRKYQRKKDGNGKNLEGEKLAAAVSGAEKLGVTWKDGAHYALALLRWTTAGFPVRSQEEVDYLYDNVCSKCEANINGRCKECRCRVSKGIALRNKIKMATEVCPKDKWHYNKNIADPLLVTDRDIVSTHALRGMLAGRDAFLVNGGPSCQQLDLSKLNNRGIFSLAVNNVGAHAQFRPSAFVCGDPPLKFAYDLWADPHIMKFVPAIKLKGSKGTLREKINGAFEKSELTVRTCPNVWGFKRDVILWPDHRFFLTRGASWGNFQKEAQITGEKRTACTMLLAIRLLHYLGAARVFILGADFHMRAEKPYAFAQDKTAVNCKSNNQQYAVVNDWLCRMQEKNVFNSAGMQLYNCYKGSRLKAFPYLPFESAIAIATRDVEPTPDLVGWYNPYKCPKCSSWHIDATTQQCLDCNYHPQGDSADVS